MQVTNWPGCAIYLRAVGPRNKHGEYEYLVWLSPQHLGIAMQGGPSIARALAEFCSYASDLSAALVTAEEKNALGSQPTLQLAALRAAGFAV